MKRGKTVSRASSRLPMEQWIPASLTGRALAQWKAEQAASMKVILVSLLFCAASLATDIRLGIIGTDTSHAVAFTAMFNDPAAKDHVTGARVVAAFRGGSPDIQSSWTRVD